MSVQVPPRPAAKARGIISRETGMCASLQIPITTGIRHAVVPVLDRKADMTAAITIMPTISLISPYQKLDDLPADILGKTGVKHGGAYDKHTAEEDDRRIGKSQKYLFNRHKARSQQKWLRKLTLPPAEVFP